MPTIYFVGVTTAQSSIMRVFPRWAEILGLRAEIRGYDLPLDAPAESYRRIVTHIRHDSMALGALVTAHKISLLEAARDLFDYLDDSARLCGEVSSISKQAGALEGHAKDPISSRLAWQAFVPPGYWGDHDAHVLCLGAGGAAIAIVAAVAGLENEADRPRKFIVVDRAAARLAFLQAIVAKLDTEIEFEYRLNENSRQNDALLAALPAASLVINATGMGKDRPGSPVTHAGVFPAQGLVWELNYRGELDFLQQAKRQAHQLNLTIEDGWVYFLHGWTQVIAQVFHLDLTPQLFAELDRAASASRG
ncbi:MAG: shikimate dehydrogenase [Chloroflexota bacterium]